MPTSSILKCSVLTIVFVAAACGGSSDSPTAPTPPATTVTTTSGSADATTVSIVGNSGSQSFSPNPSPVGQNLMVAWRNADGATHRIVANDGSFDTGNIAPGATSTRVQAPAAGANYHCSLHPTMIGALNASGGEAPPPCSGIYCD